MNWKDWFKALSGPLYELIKVLAGEEYDEEEEKQAVLKFNREISDLIAKRELNR